MKISVGKFVLSDAIKKVSKAISSKSTIPILGGIHLEATQNGLTLTGSDSDLSIKTFIPHEKMEGAEIIREGNIVLPAKEFSGIARSMPNNEVVIELLDGLKVMISSGKSNFTLNAMDGNEYPRLKETKGEGFTIKGEVLKTLMEKTFYAVSKTEARPILTGVNVFFENNGIGMQATDAHRLSKVVGDTVEGVVPTENITIPGKAVKEIPTIIGNSKDVLVKYDGTQIIFQTDELEVRSRLLEGNYPETKRLIPMDYKTLLTVDRRSFLSSMERSAILADNNRNTVTFKITDKNSGIFETIELSHQNQELGQSKEDIIVEKIEGEEITLSFNPTYMIDALKRIDDDKVVIEFNGAMRPFIIKPENKNDFIQLILPVRHY